MFYESFAEQNYKNNIQRLVYNIEKNKKIVKQFKGCCLYVARIKRMDGSFANSKPCKWCIKLLQQICFKKIFYTTGNVSSPWNCNKPRNITSTHESVGVRAQYRGEYK